MMWIETLGTIASVLVAVSLTMKNIKTLRVWNFVGAAFFSLYGFLIQSWPVFGLNAFIAGINVYYLWRESASSQRFSVFEVASPDDRYLRVFLDAHKSDIVRFHPDFRWPDPESKIFFILREGLPISLFVVRRLDELWIVDVDYALPAFRDFKNARFLFQSGIRQMNLSESPVFVAFSSVPQHERYLKKMGFRVHSRHPSGTEYRLAQ